MPPLLDDNVARIALAAALGLFLGLEREWSHKVAGIRTFSLVSLLGAVFTLVAEPALVVVGGLLVIVIGALLAVEGLLGQSEGLSITTSVSLLVAYGVGVLVMRGFVLEGVTVAVLSSLVLVLKRELHSIAYSLSREEVQAATEFAILAFVVYPLLPGGEVPVDLLVTTIPVEPRVIWLMVVTVAGIGMVNYGIVTTYGGRGVAITGFFGGLASSTAVVGTMLDHVRQNPAAVSYAVAAVLLANAAMALRNLAIAVAFSFPGALLLQPVAPLGVVVLGSIVLAGLSADWDEKVEIDLETPFRLRYALAFGAIFLVVVVAGGLAQAQFGTVGFYVTALLAGLVSSAGATTSAVLLYRSGTVSGEVATIAILLATAASIGVKAALTVGASDRSFAIRVAVYSGVVLVAAGAVALAAV